MRLKDKVSLVTGGAAGIGKATARRFAEEGARVVICDVDQNAGESVVKDIGDDVEFYRVDVTDRASGEEWIKNVTDHLGRIDVLVNNAGILRDSLLVKMKAGELIEQMSGTALRVDGGIVVGT